MEVMYFVAALALLLQARATDGFCPSCRKGGSGGGTFLTKKTTTASSRSVVARRQPHMVDPSRNGAALHPVSTTPRRISSSLASSSSSSSSSSSTGYDFDTSFLWNRGLNFGKGQFKFYSGFDSWMEPFPEQDRQAYPQLFQLPKGLYEVTLAKPLGIVFEEIDVGRGLYVQDLVDNGNAQLSGQVQVGDVLVGMTAVKIVGAKYERRMIPARKFDFDTMVGAVSSNDPRWGCDNVILMLERPGEADSEEVDAFLRFFEPPFDNPWKQQQ